MRQSIPKTHSMGSGTLPVKVTSWNTSQIRSFWGEKKLYNERKVCMAGGLCLTHLGQGCVWREKDASVSILCSWPLKCIPTSQPSGICLFSQVSIHLTIHSSSLHFPSLPMRISCHCLGKVGCTWERATQDLNFSLFSSSVTLAQEKQVIALIMSQRIKRQSIKRESRKYRLFED